mgnify:CR=1 FL=1
MKRVVVSRDTYGVPIITYVNTELTSNEVSTEIWANLEKLLRISHEDVAVLLIFTWSIFLSFYTFII